MFSKMRYGISCSNWMRLDPITSLVKEANRLQRRWKGKRQDAIAHAKLGDEKTLMAPFPHQSVGKGTIHG